MIAILPCRYPTFFPRRIESMFMLGGGDDGNENYKDAFQHMYGPTMAPSSTVPTWAWSLCRPVTILPGGRSHRRCGLTRMGWRDGSSIIMLWPEANSSMSTGQKWKPLGASKPGVDTPPPSNAALATPLLFITLLNSVSGQILRRVSHAHNLVSDIPENIEYTNYL